MQPPETPPDPAALDRPTLVLIGASVRAAAQSARRGGYRVIGIDLFGDTDTLQACDRWYQWLPDEPSNNDRILDQVHDFPILQVGGIRLTEAQAVRITGPSLAQEPWRTFEELVDCCRDLPIQFPLTTPSPPTSPLPSANRPQDERHTDRWLEKRVDGCGGLGVRWADGRVPDGNTHWQRWIRGRPHGATLIHDGEQTYLLGICRSITTRLPDRPFVYGGSIGPIRLPTNVESGIRTFADRLASARRLRGLLNVDFILDSDQQAWILEVNPRWSASMELIERRLIETEPHGSLIARAVRAAERSLSQDDNAVNDAQIGRRYVKRILFADRKTTFSRKDYQRALQHGQSLHDVPEDGTTIHPNEPICTLIEALD